MIKTCLFQMALMAVLFCRPAAASHLDDMGVPALAALVTNLNGAGIGVVQAEAGLDYQAVPLAWEAAPGSIGRPANIFTFTSADGVSGSYPNNLGTNSGHAEDVGRIFYGLPGGVVTNVARVDFYEANYFITGVVQTLTPIPGVVVNQSFVDSDTNSQADYDAIYDDYAAQFKTLFVSGAGNGGPVFPPSTCYNGLSVGAYAVGAGSSVGPTPTGGRCKPDLVASAGATSYSTPQVAGAAALLLQAAGRGDGGSATNDAADPRTLKALLLNGAVKPLGWTNAESAPLDARYGAGMVNVVNAYMQLAGGKRGCTVAETVFLGGAHPPTGATGAVNVLSGWDFATNTSAVNADAVNHYYFDVTNASAGEKFVAKTTLVWNRQQGETGINNLDLFLYACANSNLVLGSTSRVDNVEHLFVPQLAPGRYDLQVWKAGGLDQVSPSETYALAFEFALPPTLAITGGTRPELTWPVYPAGYGVVSATNLTAPVWRTNNLPLPVVTNSRNSLYLSRTNDVRFYRLRQPHL